MLKRIYFTVTNDLNHDRRMQRICTTLATHGYPVTLIGRRTRRSGPLTVQPFRQQRIFCLFARGKLFYLEYTVKLFFFLLFKPRAILCAIDLDTIYPVLLVSRLRKSKRVYDAHELFTGMKEIVTRPAIHRIWSWLEKTTVPHFRQGYTVSQSIAGELSRRYGVQYGVIRNIPPLSPTPRPVPALHLSSGALTTPVPILYQGAVNEGRGLEYLIPAMQQLNAVLWICGDGNFMKRAQQLVQTLALEDKVLFKGMLLPEELEQITPRAYIGMNLVEPVGLNQVYSLTNKYFDYMHAAVPQVAMDLPEYASINKEYEVAVLLKELSVKDIVEKVNLLMENTVLYTQMQQNCLKAREIYNWGKEEKKLLELYEQILSDKH